MILICHCLRSVSSTPTSNGHFLNNNMHFFSIWLQFTETVFVYKLSKSFYVTSILFRYILQERLLTSAFLHPIQNRTLSGNVFVISYRAPKNISSKIFLHIFHSCRSGMTSKHVTESHAAI